MKKKLVTGLVLISVHCMGILAGARGNLSINEQNMISGFIAICLLVILVALSRKGNNMNERGQSEAKDLPDANVRKE